MSNLLRFIKNKHGEKLEMRVHSVNLRVDQIAFIKSEKLKLSSIIREVLDGLIEESKNNLKRGVF